MTTEIVDTAVRIDPTLFKLILGIGGGLVTAVIALWRMQVANAARIMTERDEALEKLEAAEKRATEELKARVAEQALFLRALQSKRSGSSDPSSS